MKIRDAPTAHQAKRRSVVILIGQLNFGGAEKQALTVAGGLSDRGWSVTVVTFLDPPAEDHRGLAPGVPIISLKVGRRGSPAVALFRLIRTLRKISPDILLTFMYQANVLGRVAGRVVGVPVVSSIRNEHFGGNLRDRAERITHRLANAIVVNSASVGKALVARKVLNADRLRVIHNGISLPARVSEEQRSLLREALGVAANEFLWLAVGRIDLQKDYPNLVDAVAKIPPQGRWRVWIAGSGPRSTEVEQMIADRGLSARVQMMGFRTDVPTLLLAADALVLSSTWEGSPNAVLEAMAVGLPIVATDVGGVADVIGNGVGGILVQPSDATELAGAMTRLMRMDADARKRLGLAGRRVIEDGFQFNAICDQWESLLSESLRKRRSGVAN